MRVNVAGRMQDKGWVALFNTPPRRRSSIRNVSSYFGNEIFKTAQLHRDHCQLSLDSHERPGNPKPGSSLEERGPS